ncbi:MAG TPA: IclR family transcriptional regulator [Bordetella sp.]
MPRKSSIPSLADQNAASGGVAAVDRALSLLDAFSLTAPLLTLAEIAHRTQLHKSTVLRMLASLEHAHLVQKREDGRYALGAGIERLHRIHALSFSLGSVVMPVLGDLVARTQESAAFHVRQGDQRLCLHRVDSPRPVRDHLAVGALLPMDRGAGGRVLSAWPDANDPISQRIRREFVVTLVGDRLPELAGVASPVFGAGGELVGALTLTMPAERLESGFDRIVLAHARKLTALLGGSYPQ